MLKRSSKFILEVFPYLSAALIAAAVLPGYLYSQVHGFRAVATQTFPAINENTPEIVHRGHAAFAHYKGVRARYVTRNQHRAENEMAYR